MPKNVGCKEWKGRRRKSPLFCFLVLMLAAGDGRVEDQKRQGLRRLTASKLKHLVHMILDGYRKWVVDYCTHLKRLRAPADEEISEDGMIVS